jgi:hypothetical protein
MACSTPPFLPNDHLKLLIEFLQPVGPELVRRWVAILAAVDPADRGALVAELERRVSATAAASEIRVVHPPVLRKGYVEQVEVTYERLPSGPGEAARAKPQRRA